MHSDNGRGHTLLMAFFAICTLLSVLCSTTEAKVYIDITSPAIRRLPISITTHGPSGAREVEETVKDDLEFTGLFTFVAPEVPGAEMTVRLDIEISDEVKAIASVADLVGGEEVLKKQYKGAKSIIRAIAHSISNDIYKAVTGRDGIFRTKVSYLAYVSADNRELRIMDWDGQNTIKVIPIGLTSSHGWSHDSERLIYGSERNREWKIYSFNLNDFKETVLFSSKGLNLVGNASPLNEVTFSSSKDGNSEIYTMNMNGGNLRKVTTSFGIDVSPSFSPDGKSIAFVSDRGGSPQIYIINTDRSGLRRLTFEGSYNTSPAWSPDGKWIAYVGQKDGKNQIFMIKSDATGQRQITFTGNNESPSFSPDGMFLAFDSDSEGKRGIYIMRINGEEKKRITPKDIKAISPKWSPYLK